MCGCLSDRSPIRTSQLDGAINPVYCHVRSVCGKPSSSREEILVKSAVAHHDYTFWELLKSLYLMQIIHEIPCAAASPAGEAMTVSFVDIILPHRSKGLVIIKTATALQLQIMH